jgi:hypothetical protein
MAEEETPQPLGESQGANAPKDKKEWAKKSELHMVKGRNLTRDILTRLRENEIAEAANKMAAMENANRDKEMKKIEVAKKATKHTEVIVTSFKCIQDIEEVILQTEDSCSKLRHEKYAGFAALQVCVRRLELRAERPAAETFDDRLHQALKGEKKTLEDCRKQIEAYEKEGHQIVKDVQAKRAELSRDTGERRLDMAHDKAELIAAIMVPAASASANAHLDGVQEEGAPAEGEAPKEEAPKEAVKEEAPKEGEAPAEGAAAPSPKNGNPKKIIEETNSLLSRAHNFRLKSLAYVQEAKFKAQQAGAYCDECLARRCHDLAETKKSLEQSALDVDAAIDTASRALNRTQKRLDPRDKKKAEKLQSDMQVLKALKDTRAALGEDIRNKFTALEIDNMCRRVTPQKADAAAAEKLKKSGSQAGLGATSGGEDMNSTAATMGEAGNESMKLPPIEGATPAN